MRVIFMGTPDFALAPLAEIFGRGHEVVAVYSRAPKPAGRRGLELTPSPVHAAAERYGLKVLTPKNFRDPETVQEFSRHDADVAVVVAYGLILPKDVLAAPRLGCLNLHGSLLPRWRGAAPIQRAIMAGDRGNRRRGHADGGGARHRPHRHGGKAHHHARHDGRRSA